ncbi:hypothetical protein H0W26_02125 [Candidatus Dependentiae bacterium]|nr:hypothetical protein [Candidatus Dependentiae bacterium]
MTPHYLKALVLFISVFGIVTLNYSEYQQPKTDQEKLAETRRARRSSPQAAETSAFFSKVAAGAAAGKEERKAAFEKSMEEARAQRKTPEEVKAEKEAMLKRFKFTQVIPGK